MYLLLNNYKYLVLRTIMTFMQCPLPALTSNQQWHLCIVLFQLLTRLNIITFIYSIKYQTTTITPTCTHSTLYINNPRIQLHAFIEQYFSATPWTCILNDSYLHIKPMWNSYSLSTFSCYYYSISKPCNWNMWKKKKTFKPCKWRN